MAHSRTIQPKPCFTSMAFKTFKKRLPLLSGLSLIELLASMSLFVVLLLMVGSVYISHIKLFTNQTQNIDASNQNVIAIDEIASQLKEADYVYFCPVSIRCDTSSYTPNPPTPWLSNGDNSNSTKLIIHLWPLDADSNPADPSDLGYPAEDMVAYFLANGTTLKKVTITYASGDPISKRLPDCGNDQCQSTKILATGIQGLTFSYYDTNNNIVAPPTINSGNYLQVSDVVVTLTSTGYSPGSQQNDIITTRRVNLRNRGDS